VLNGLQARRCSALTRRGRAGLRRRGDETSKRRCTVARGREFPGGGAGEGGRRGTTTRFATHVTQRVTRPLIVVVASLLTGYPHARARSPGTPACLPARPSVQPTDRPTNRPSVRDDGASPPRDTVEVMTTCSRGWLSRAWTRTINGREYTTSFIHVRSARVLGRR
jgi:hypothetical protein